MSKEAYEQYEKLLRELHELIAQGKGETDEADEIRDRMDRPWHALTLEEQERLSQLSEELYEQDKERIVQNKVHFRE